MPQAYCNGELVIVIDCADLDRSARFWSAVLGYQAAPASGRYQTLYPAAGALAGNSSIEVLLQLTGDAKRAKNRMHLDLRTADLDAEVGRILRCGATRVTTQPVSEDGMHWHVLADPDGNEFCVLQPPGPATPPG